VAGQGANTATEHDDKRLGEGRLIEVDDVLDNIVAEGILDQGDGILGDLLDQPDLLVAGSVVDAALKDTAAMAVGADINTVGPNGIEDELGISGAQLVEALLDDVVAVQVLDELDDPVAKGINDDADLGRRRDKLDHLLKGSSAMLVQGDTDHVLCSILDEDGTLLIVAVLKELLAEVVAEGVCHQLNHVLVGLQPNHVNLFRDTVLELLLQVTTTMLVLAELVDSSTDGLEGQVDKAAHSY
jgi:hypothetical protein